MLMSEKTEMFIPMMIDLPVGFLDVLLSSIGLDAQGIVEFSFCYHFDRVIFSCYAIKWDV